MTHFKAVRDHQQKFLNLISLGQANDEIILDMEVVERTMAHSCDYGNFINLISYLHELCVRSSDNQKNPKRGQRRA